MNEARRTVPVSQTDAARLYRLLEAGLARYLQEYQQPPPQAGYGLVNPVRVATVSPDGRPTTDHVALDASDS